MTKYRITMSLSFQYECQTNDKDSVNKKSTISYWSYDQMILFISSQIFFWPYLSEKPSKFTTDQSINHGNRFEDHTSAAFKNNKFVAIWNAI